jgi:predicted lysophospholipase L1 biosynthesis ABC-type transport system permease subunit
MPVRKHLPAITIAAAIGTNALKNLAARIFFSFKVESLTTQHGRRALARQKNTTEIPVKLAIGSIAHRGPASTCISTKLSRIQTARH